MKDAKTPPDPMVCPSAGLDLLLGAASVGAKGVIETHLSDIEGIGKCLSNDLSPKGIEAITPTALTSMRDGAALKNAAKPMVSAIDSARAETAKGGQK